MEILDAWHCGESPDTLAVLERFPNLHLDDSVVIDLAYEEYCLLREHGEVDLEQFCARHPRQRTELRHLIETHQGLEAGLFELPDIAWPDAGQEFEGYHLVRQLGRGAFARVFLAWHESTNRHVALKLAASDAADAQVAGPLSHPALVPILDARALATGLSFVSMPYLGRATLTDLLNNRYLEGPCAPVAEQLRSVIGRSALSHELPVERFFDPGLTRASWNDAVTILGREIARGLAFLHGRGIQHRDLKPSNVLLAWNGQPVILDFNLAHHGRIEFPLCGGTLPYMAPEQIQSFLEIKCVGALNERADIYSFGVMLHELLSGKHLFAMPEAERPLGRGKRQARQTAAWTLNQKRAGVPPLTEAAAGIDPALARLIHCCLSFDPQFRPTAAEVEAWLTRSRRWPYRARRWAARHRGAVVAATILMVSATSASSGWLALREPWEAREYQRGRAAFAKADYDSANVHFDNLLRKNHHDARALFAYGVTLSRQGTFSSAVSAFQRVDELAPSGQNTAMWAYAKAQENDLTAARALAQQAIDQGFRTAAIYEIAGATRMWIDPAYGQFEEARSYLDTSIQLDDKMQAAWLSRAQVYLNQWGRSQNDADLNCAKRDIDKAIELGPDSQRLYFVAAKIYGSHTLNKDQHHQAEFTEMGLAYLSKAIELGLNPRQFPKKDPAFKQLSKQPGFRKLLALEPLQLTIQKTDPIFVDPSPGTID